MNIDELVDSELYKSITRRLNPKLLLDEARKTLIDRLIAFRDMKTSAAWYMSEQQAQEFSNFMLAEEQREGSNAYRELKLIDRLFNNIKLSTSVNHELEGKTRITERDIFALGHHEFSEAINRINLVDLGPGNGQKAKAIIKHLRNHLPGREIRYVPLDASQYMNAIALANISTIPRDNSEFCTFDTNEFSKSIKQIPEEYASSLRGICKSSTDIFTTMLVFITRPENVTYLAGIKPDRLTALKQAYKPKSEEFRKYLENNNFHKWALGKSTISPANISADGKEYADTVWKYSHLIILNDMMNFYLEIDPKMRNIEKIDIRKVASLLEEKVASLTPENLSIPDIEPDFFYAKALCSITIMLNEIHSTFAGLRAYMTYADKKGPLGYRLNPEKLPELEEKVNWLSKKISFLASDIPRLQDPLLKDNYYAHLLWGLKTIAEFSKEVIDPYGLVSRINAHKGTETLIADKSGVTLDFLNSDLQPVFKTIKGLTTDSSAVNVILLLGQTLGNFTSQERQKIIDNLYDSMGWGDYFLLGVELRPSKNLSPESRQDAIEKILNGYRGPDAEKFFQQSFKLLNSPADAIKPTPTYEDETVKMNLTVTKPFKVKTGLFKGVSFNPGEVIPFGESHKFDFSELINSAKNSGFTEVRNEPYTTPLVKDKEGRTVSGGDEYGLVLFRKGTNIQEKDYRMHWGFGKEWKYGENKDEEIFWFENNGKATTVDVCDRGGRPVGILPGERVYFAERYTKLQPWEQIRDFIKKQNYHPYLPCIIPWVEVEGVRGQAAIVFAEPLGLTRSERDKRIDQRVKLMVGDSKNRGYEDFWRSGYHVIDPDKQRSDKK